MAESRSSHFRKKISRLLTGRIIWPNSLSPVNLTDFPLEQQTVPSVLSPKSIAKTGELLKTRWAVMLTVGGPGLTSSLHAMDIPCSVSPHDSVLYSPVNVLIFLFLWRDLTYFVTLSAECWSPRIIRRDFARIFPISSVVSIYARSHSVFTVISSLFLGVVPFLLLARSSGP